MAGYRTYILALAASLVTLLYALGYCSPDHWAMTMAMLGFGTQVTQRAAIGKKKR